MRSEVNSIPLTQNCVLKVIELPKAFETSFEAVAEVAKKSRFVGVTIRGEVNSIPEYRNCVFEVTQLPEVLETSEEGVAKVVKMSGFLGVTMRSEVNNTPLIQNHVLKVTQLPKALETSFEGVAEVAKTGRFLGVTIGGERELAELQSGRRKRPARSSPLPKSFNINTYKFHTLGDYSQMIKTFGTTDSYSTQVVS